MRVFSLHSTNVLVFILKFMYLDSYIDTGPNKLSIYYSVFVFLRFFERNFCDLAQNTEFRATFEFVQNAVKLRGITGETIRTM